MNYRIEELVDFCRNNGLSTAGGKLEIKENHRSYCVRIVCLYK